MNRSQTTRWLVTAALAMVWLAGMPTTDAADSGGAEPAGGRKQADRIVPGDAAPGFTLPDQAGSSHSLEEITGDKSLALIFFRGVW